MTRTLASKRLSMREAASYLDVHICTLWRWALHGVRGRRLRTFLLGGRRYVVLADLEAFAHPDEQGNEAGMLNRGDDSPRSAIVAAELIQRGV